VLKETSDDSLGHSNFILHEVEKEIVKADIELYIKAGLTHSLDVLYEGFWMLPMPLQTLGRHQL